MTALPAHLQALVDRELALPSAHRNGSSFYGAVQALPPDYDHLVLEYGKRNAPDGAHGTLNTPDGEIPVTQIGKGTFSTIYREHGGAGRVFALADDDVKDKEILSVARRGNPHIPNAQRFGSTSTQTVWVMPYYRAPLRKRDSPKGYRDFLTAQRCLALAEERLGYDEHGYALNYSTVACSREHDMTPDTADALESLMGTAANYDEEYHFEFSPRNVATDDEGNLIWLDVLFNKNQLEALHKAEAKKRAPGWF